MAVREQRLSDILGTVRENGYMTAQELADKFGVSLSTIRRDLTELNQRGAVAISKNGVVPILETIVDTPVRLIGGEMSPPSQGFFGPAAEHALRRYNFDLAFFSPVAVTPQGFAAETVEHSASLRRVAMEQTQSSVLLFDNSKIGLTRPYNIAHIDAFRYLITDDDKPIPASKAVVRRVQL